MGLYTVNQGDCLSSIAQSSRLDPDAIWNHESNASLRALRQNFNILRPGDLVFIPEQEKKSFEGSTNQLHTFRLTRRRTFLRLRLLKDGDPRAGEAYRIDLGRCILDGITDVEGLLQHVVPPDCAFAMLHILTSNERFRLKLGHLNPIEDLSGVQSRLRNLGFYHGSTIGDFNAETVDAVASFQTSHGLRATGHMDDVTREVLQEAYGS